MPDYAGNYSTPRLDLGMALHEYRETNPEADFIGVEALPVFKVNKQAATYSKITRQSQLQAADTKRSLRGKYNRINFGARDDSYSCENHGLEAEVDDAEREMYASDFDAEFEATLVAHRAVMLGHEQRVASLLFNKTSSAFSSANAALYTDKTSAPWTTPSVDVVAHIRDAKAKVWENSGREANTLIISRKTLDRLLANTVIQGRFPGASVLTEAMLRDFLASILGIEKLLVGRARYNSQPINEDADAWTGANVWSDLYALVCVTAPGEGSPILTPCLGRTMLWEDYASDLWTVESYREEQSESDIVRVKNFVDEKIHDYYFGHLLEIAAA